MLQRILSYLVITFISLTTLYASHFMGVDVSYQCLGPCTYRIVHDTYYDCAGSATSPLPGPPPAPFISFIGTPGTCTAPDGSTLTWIFESYEEVTPLCPGAQTQCTGGGSGINGVLQGRFYTDVNVCGTGCSQINIEWSNCCRNYAITSGAQGNGIYSGNTAINLGLTPCNSSPVFNNPPVPYICAGQQFNFNQGAFDPDGDSLSYSLGDCYQGLASTVTYNAGYSATAPLGPTWNVTIDPVTGDVSMIPNPGNSVVGVMCVYVTEWRNGVQIGEVSRDMQITVIPCTYTTPEYGGIQNATGNGISIPPTAPNILSVCAGTQTCFEIPTQNAVSGTNYTFTWNNGLPGGLFYNSANPSQIDTVTGTNPVATVCWTPPAPGIYSFVVTLTDDNCPIQGSSQGTIQVIVSDGTNWSTATSSVNSCNDAVYTAFLDPNATGHPFHYIWSGDGNLNLNPNNTDSTFTHSYPAPGMYNWQCQVIDTFGCITTIQGTTTIQNGAIADAGGDVSLCSGYSFNMGSAPIAGQTYSWSPATGLNNTNISNPVITYTNTGTSPDTLHYTVSVTNALCSTEDYVDVIVFPTPQVDITPNNPAICNNSNITLTATGGTSYLWNTGATTASITVSPNTTTTYSVVAIQNGCSSPPAYETVTVNYGPIGQINGTFSLCEGENTTLTATGGTTYLWSDNSTGNTLTLSNVQTSQTVWMIPTDNGCPGDTIFATVNPFNIPTPAFNSNVVCAGNPTTFADLSSVVGGNIVQWNWDFGDIASGPNNSSAQSSPNHVFSQSGNFNVTLTVSSNNGCTNSITQTVNVADVPIANFAQNNLCFGNTMSFTDQSTIGAGNTITGYAWDFGDPSSSTNTSTLQNPTHDFSNFGYYNVSLTVSSSNGCNATYTRTVFVHPNPVANFAFQSDCYRNAISFNSTATVAGTLDYINTWTWDFGDPASGASNYDNGYAPQHTFTAPGTYNVSFTVTTNNGCSNSINLPVVIYPEPSAEFSHSQNCANQIMQFTDLSTGDPNTPNSSYNWSFNNGQGTSNAQNPSFNLGQNGAGTYPVTLIVGNTVGCTDTLTKDIIVNPVPYTGFSNTTVCLGEPTTFTALDTIQTGANVGWAWTLGDGVGTSNADSAFNYQYAAHGTYTVTFTVTSDSGCVHTGIRNIAVWALPLIGETIGDTVCIGESAILFASNGTNDGIRWYDDALGTNQIYSGVPYLTHPLIYTETYYVRFRTPNGCFSHVYPVVADVFDGSQVQMIISDTSVEMPANPITFSTQSTSPITSWNWNIAGYTSSQPEVVLESLLAGRYEASVTVMDENGCPATITRPFEVKRLTNLSIPSAFSPNGDGMNDLMKVGHHNVSMFNIEVFDRWGAKVFTSDNVDFQWDGRDMRTGKDIPEGVYMYKAIWKAFDARQEEEVGTITVIR